VQLQRIAIRTLVVLACLSLAAAASAADPQKKDGARPVGLNRKVAEKLLQAYELLEEDQYDASLAIVDEVARRRKLGPPELAQIHRFRGYIFVNKGLSEEASAEFEKCLAQNALDLAAEQVTTYSLAQLYTQLGNYDRALELVERFFQREEAPRPDAYFLKAMILVQQDRFADALEPARTAVEQSPQPKESWLQTLMVIYSQTKDYPNLAATLERLIALNPTKKLYWVQLAAVHKQLEHDARALAALQLAELAGLLTEDREYRQLARLLFLRELPYRCATGIEQAAAGQKIAPDAEAYRLLANCYLAAREGERALEPLARAGELAPDGEMYLLLGQLHLQRERFEPALDALHKALAKATPPQRAPIQLLIGVAELGSDDFAGAERAFHAARSDERVGRAAESYLKYLSEQRARREQQKLLQTAARGAGFTESPHGLHPKVEPGS
jgi:tetratricopeptide (TPR) repeat protein